MDLTKFSNLNGAYIYPMANATNGGESHSEYNIRNSLASLLSYSASFSANEDFNVNNVSFTKNFSVDEKESGLEEINNSGILRLAVSSGKGNCNGYFVECEEFGRYEILESGQVIDNRESFNIDFNEWSDYLPKINAETNELAECKFNLGLYLCVDYANNIASRLSYKLIQNKVYDYDSSLVLPETEYTKIYKNHYKNLGFNDIGIHLGDISVSYSPIYGFNSSGTFEKNENKTACIDLSRLGSSLGLQKELAKILNRLETLDIYGGEFYISDTMLPVNGTINEDVEDIGVINKFGNAYKLKIVCNRDINDNSKIVGGMHICKSVDNYSNTNASFENVGTIFNFEYNSVVGEFSLIFDKFSVTDIEITSANISKLDSTDAYITKLHFGKSYIFGDDESITINTGTINASSATINAGKVYGAVWM